MTTPVNPLSVMATTPGVGKQNGSGSTWYQAMAEAWGAALDEQAGKLQTLGDQISAGGDQPSAMTMMSAESLKMSFLANSSHTSLTSTGEALKTMAQKS